MQTIRIDDESGDRKYFTMVPNYVLNHSGVVEQALYLQMKRYAGESGTCFASGKTMRKKLGIGMKSYQAALKYLIDHEWVYEKGKQVVETKGGPQLVKVYGLRDLWKLNTEHYDKGGSKRTPLSQRGSQKDAKGVLKVIKGGAESDYEEEHKKNIRKGVSPEESEEIEKKILIRRKRLEKKGVVTPLRKKAA